MNFSGVQNKSQLKIGSQHAKICSLLTLNNDHMKIVASSCSAGHCVGILQKPMFSAFAYKHIIQCYCGVWKGKTR